MANSNKEIVADLFKWLEHAEMPICADGDFLAFRRVRDDWMDPHSGTVKYTPGQITEIDKAKCTFDRAVDCGPGLHFANRHYSFNGSRILLVKIDPRWVTSIPRTDSSKGRCHRMFVVRQVTEEERDIDFQREGSIASLIGHDGKPVPVNYADRGDPESDDAPLAPLPASAATVAPQPLVDTPFVGHPAFSISKRAGDDDKVPAKPIPKTVTEQTMAKGLRPKTFTHRGVTYTARQIEKGVEEHGQRGFAGSTGIPRTTLQNWIKLLNGE